MSSTTLDKPLEFYCFTPDNRVVHCNSRTEISAAIDRYRGTWFSGHAATNTAVVETLVGCSSRGGLGDLLVGETPEQEDLTLLNGFFRQTIGAMPGFKWLPLDQLVEVLSGPNDERRDLIIGGVALLKHRLLILLRGNRRKIVVPFSMFPPSGTGLEADFGRFELDDYGHTLRFGEYEAATDAVLWERDPEYRKRLNAKEKAQAKGFGPSLRRLRIQRGLTQSDFPGVDRKTISRIENGETAPQRKTLEVIASKLGVAPDEIESY